MADPRTLYEALVKAAEEESLLKLFPEIDESYSLYQAIKFSEENSKEIVANGQELFHLTVPESKKTKRKKKKASAKPIQTLVQPSEDLKVKLREKREMITASRKPKTALEEIAVDFVAAEFFTAVDYMVHGRKNKQSKNAEFSELHQRTQAAMQSFVNFMGSEDLDAGIELEKNYKAYEPIFISQAIIMCHIDEIRKNSSSASQSISIEKFVAHYIKFLMTLYSLRQPNDLIVCDGLSKLSLEIKAIPGAKCQALGEILDRCYHDIFPRLPKNMCLFQNSDNATEDKKVSNVSHHPSLG